MYREIEEMTASCLIDEYDIETQNVEAGGPEYRRDAVRNEILKRIQPHTLTIADVIALSTIVDVASQSARVRWIDSGGTISEGTARHIVRSADDYTFIPQTMDVRDAFLRITTAMGMEITIPVNKLMDMIMRGEFVKD